MKARLFVISFVTTGLALLLVWVVAAQGTETKGYASQVHTLRPSQRIAQAVMM